SKLRYCKRTGTLKMFDNRFRHVSVKSIEEECAGDFLRWTTFRLHQLVYFRVRHGLNHIDQRRERSEGGEYLLAIADIACVCHQCHDDQLAMMFFRQEGHRRTDHDVGNCRKLIWGGFRLRNEFGDHIGRRRKNQHSADNLIDLMQPEFEAGDDAEVATATANRPEEIRMVVGVYVTYFAISGDDLSRQQVVHGETMLTNEKADTAAECKTANTD